MKLTFDPAKLAAAKQRARDKDARLLEAGILTEADLRRQNFLFQSLDFSKVRAIGPRGRKKPKTKQ